MNPSDDKQRLLDDLLDEGSEVWRETALNSALAAGRRRRTIRRTRNGLMATAALILLGTFLRTPQPAIRPHPVSAISGLALVRSIPLDSKMLVHSHEAGLFTIHSTVTSVDQVATGAFPFSLPIIGDNELLRLAGRGSALVRHGTGEVTLIRLEDFSSVDESTAN